MADASAETRLDPAPLLPLPGQDPAVPWPTGSWPAGKAPPAVADLVGDAFSPGAEERLGTTYAVVVVRGGRLLLERYGGRLPAWEGAGEEVGPGTPLLSWSMAKSVLHAAVGVLVGRGALSVQEPAPVPDWAGPGDPRRRITLEDLLEMRDGLDFLEDYEDVRHSDVLRMLFGEASSDMAGYAVSRTPAAPPGTRFNYSSGTSNILAAIVGRAVGGPDGVRSLVEGELLGTLGASSARIGFDSAGTWVASSYLHATAVDFARFGHLYLRDGVWDGRRILPEGWVDHGRLPRSVDPEDGTFYGAHWWSWGPDDPLGTFWASGFEGQRILVCPAADAVVVRLGRTTEERMPAFRQWCRDVTAALADPG